MYTTTFINNNFRIKVYGISNGRKYNTLVGVSGILKIIDLEMLMKLVKKAVERGLDKFVCKLRRGIKITLYTK